MATLRRYSRQRERIYQAVHASREHPSAQMVYDLLREEMPRLSLSALEEPAPVRSAAEAGWQVERYSLMLEGICPACAGKDHNEI